MAVITQHPYINEKGKEDKNYVKFYSDKRTPLIKLQTGEEYEEAIDLYPSKFTYVEKQENKIVEGVIDYDGTRNSN